MDLIVCHSTNEGKLLIKKIVTSTFLQKFTEFEQKQTLKDKLLAIVSKFILQTNYKYIVFLAIKGQILLEEP